VSATCSLNTADVSNNSKGRHVHHVCKCDCEFTEADSTGVCSISTAANRYFISAHSVIYARVCESEGNVLIKAHGKLKRIRGPISRNYAFR